MVYSGHISIKDNKVIFVYYERPKPDLDDYTKDSAWGYAVYNADLDKYEASKREVEVSNAKFYKYLTFNYANVFIEDKNSSFPIIFNVKHNQPCEAEVNGKAIITKIT